MGDTRSCLCSWKLADTVENGRTCDVWEVYSKSLLRGSLRSLVSVDFVLFALEVV